ncbi:hypothetical protein DM02DRAFT_620690 [Periconia macrospinosa]|uniref:Uncharacterized protein n=1 Tax=Periconia macrospinosa TaxID=97972 RepID=A0A2V1CZE7_9PLEO|nr:hypothetical protein DM02DRAFT_620690 [Periconia macrospinosa]
MTRIGRDVLIEIRRKQRTHLGMVVFGGAGSTDWSLLRCRSTRFHYDKGSVEIQWRSPQASPRVNALDMQTFSGETRAIGCGLLATTYGHSRCSGR